MKNAKRVLLFVIVMIGVPVFIDWVIFGNTFPSNIDNQAWAGFLGSYLGGVATLIAVFITIRDNNKKLELQKKEDEEKEREQKRYSIKPYLDTRYNFFEESSIVGSNDRVFDMKGHVLPDVGRYALQRARGRERNPVCLLPCHSHCRSPVPQSHDGQTFIE